MEVYFIIIPNEATDSSIREKVEKIFEGFNGEVPLNRLREDLKTRLGADLVTRIRNEWIDSNPSLKSFERSYKGKVYTVLNGIVYQRIPTS